MTAIATDVPAGPIRLHLAPPKRRLQLLAFVKLLDVSTMVAAFVGATLVTGWSAGHVSLDTFVSTRLKVSNFLLFLALVGSWRATFWAVGLYGDPRSPLTLRRLRECVKAIGFATLTLSCTAILFHIELITPLFLATFLGMAFAFVLGGRVATRSALRLLGKAGTLDRAVLIAGTNPRALRIAARMERDGLSSARIVGFVDEEWAGSATFRTAGRTLVSDLKNLNSFLRENVIDELVIALPASVLCKHRSRVLHACREHGIMVRFPASLLIDSDNEARGRLADEIVMTVYNGSVEGWQLIVKRFLDVILASLLSVLAIPTMLLVAVLIKATSPGPVFFVQERMGLNKRRFRLHKFRTMHIGAEHRLAELEHLNETAGPTFKLTQDPRITPIGRFLRKSSLDELPQLFHVLKGEMSLVGPRPLAVRDVNGFEDDRHRRRFGVRPGLTGLWQVSGRSLVPFEDWMELDLRYVDDWSLALDAKILLKTIPVVLSGKGAL